MLRRRTGGGHGRAFYARRYPPVKVDRPVAAVKYAFAQILCPQRLNRELKTRGEFLRLFGGVAYLSLVPIIVQIGSPAVARQPVTGKAMLAIQSPGPVCFVAANGSGRHPQQIQVQIDSLWNGRLVGRAEELFQCADNGLGLIAGDAPGIAGFGIQSELRRRGPRTTGKQKKTANDISHTY